MNPIVTSAADRATVVGVEYVSATSTRDDFVYVARPKIAAMFVVDRKDQRACFAAWSSSEQTGDEFSASAVDLLAFL